MIRYRGLTWDHPRGFNALAAAADHLSRLQDEIAIAWEKQPLEGFESHPIADLCGTYDLVVLDHPHIGEATSDGCLQSLESLFSADEIAGWSRDTIGPCLASYRYSGQHWALPLDAATQVMAWRQDLVDQRPRTWDEILSLSERQPVALSVTGPHALLTFFSLAVALGEAPAEREPGVLVSSETAARALDIMASLYGRMPAAARPLNPIGLLQMISQGRGVGRNFPPSRAALRRDRDVARRAESGSSGSGNAAFVGRNFGSASSAEVVVLCPLVYGYVNYAAPAEGMGHPVAFANAPRATTGGRPGSTLGGTGIGISRRCHVTPPLLDHLRWLMSRAAQMDFIPAHDGQPSRREAWLEAGVNARWGNFYRNTAETLEHAYIRPRHNGYIPFQTEASGIIRQGLEERTPSGVVLARLQDGYIRSRAGGAER